MLGKVQTCTPTYLVQCTGADDAEDMERDQMITACTAVGHCSFGYVKFYFEWIQLALFLLFMVEFFTKVVG